MSIGSGADRRYGNNGARRSSGGPIGVGGASVVPGLCWETRTSLYRLRWRRRVVPGSRLGRHQPRHGGRRRWRCSAKLRIQYRRMRLILSAHRLTLPPLPLIVSRIPLWYTSLRILSLFFFLDLPVSRKRRKKRFKQSVERLWESDISLSVFPSFLPIAYFQSVPCYLSCSRAPVLGWYQFCGAGKRL